MERSSSRSSASPMSSRVLLALVFAPLAETTTELSRSEMVLRMSALRWVVARSMLASLRWATSRCLAALP